MSNKLNAEELAAKIERLSSNLEGNVAKWVNEDLMDIAQHIREVAQPIADERDEAIKRAETAEAHAVIFAQKLAAMTDERDELLKVLENCLWVLDGTVAAGRNTIADDEVLRNGKAILAKYPKQ
jgi:hypothetical protein